MYDEKEIRRIEDRRKRWDEEIYRPLIEKRPERLKRFDNLSWTEIGPLYTPADVKDFDYERRSGNSSFRNGQKFWT